MARGHRAHRCDRATLYMHLRKVGSVTRLLSQKILSQGKDRTEMSRMDNVPSVSSHGTRDMICWTPCRVLETHHQLRSTSRATKGILKGTSDSRQLSRLVSLEANSQVTLYTPNLDLPTPPNVSPPMETTRPPRPPPGRSQERAATPATEATGHGEPRRSSGRPLGTGQ